MYVCVCVCVRVCRARVDLSMTGAGPSQKGPTVRDGTICSARGVLEGLVCDLLLLFAAHSDLANAPNVWA